MSEELERGIPKAIVTGKIEFTEEENSQNRKNFIKFLKESGYIRNDKNITDSIIKD